MNVELESAMTHRVALLLFLLILALHAQGQGGHMRLTTPAFAPGGEIPAKYTCSGDDASPALDWSGAPAKTASFALIMDDPDAPSGVWVHWVVWNLPQTAHSLAEGLAKTEQLDNGAKQGMNSPRKIGYHGPCPPPGQTHRYFFRLYALDTKLDLPAGATRSELDAAMQGHIVGQAEYMGKFHR
jgi:Raf kinase inhibitor-like YbhB/YbcL family protein